MSLNPLNTTIKILTDTSSVLSAGKQLLQKPHGDNLLDNTLSVLHGTKNLTDSVKRLGKDFL